MQYDHTLPQLPSAQPLMVMVYRTLYFQFLYNLIVFLMIKEVGSNTSFSSTLSVQVKVEAADDNPGPRKHHANLLPSGKCNWLN